MLPLLVLALSACGDPAIPTTGEPALSTVNGGRHPVVSPGQVAGWSGFGFGAEQGSALLLVTTTGGVVPLTPLAWSDVGILARLPDDLVSGPTWVLTAGDTLGPVRLRVRPPASYAASGRAWTESAVLPEPRAGGAAAGLLYPGDQGVNGIVVLFGGARDDGSLSNATHLGQVDGSGRIFNWLAAPDTIIPSARRDHAMTAGDETNSRIARNTDPPAQEAVAYVIGGRDSAGNVLASVTGIAVNATGGYGFWSELTPVPGARAGAAAITAFGNVIVIGGYGADSAALTDVTVATITQDGILNGWFGGPRLPEGRAFPAVALFGQTLIVTGGQTGIIDPSAGGDTVNLTSTVYAIRLNPITGAFLDSTWTPLSTLLHPRARHAVFALDDAVVVTGGAYPGMPGAGETEFALVAADGTLGAFTESTIPAIASTLGAPFWSFGVPRLLAADGTARATVLGGATPAGGSARTWSQ